MCGVVCIAAGAVEQAMCVVAAGAVVQAVCGVAAGAVVQVACAVAGAVGEYVPVGLYVLLLAAQCVENT